MTQQEFQSQVERLKSVYGDRAYPDERVKLLWSAAGSLPGDWFRRTVDSLIGGMRQAPVLSDFQEAIGAERERVWRSQKAAQLSAKVMDFARCSWCGGNGVVLARRKDDHTPWAFKCRCSNARNDNRNYPIFSESDEYEVIGA